MHMQSLLNWPIPPKPIPKRKMLQMALAVHLEVECLHASQLTASMHWRMYHRMASVVEHLTVITDMLTVTDTVNSTFNYTADISSMSASMELKKQ